jgi:hypothetical protein
MKPLARFTYPLMLCSIPGLVGFVAGILCIEAPTLFLAMLILIMGTIFYFAVKSYLRSGKVDGRVNSQVEAAAGVCLGLSFLTSFWSGLGYAAKLGIVQDMFVVALGTAFLAAFTLTFIQKVVDHKILWVDALLERLSVDGRANSTQREV